MLGRYGEAEQRYHEALPIFRNIGDRLGEANTVLWLANFSEAARVYRAIGIERWADIASNEGSAIEAQVARP